jgi:hypothetical protein
MDLVVGDLLFAHHHADLRPTLLADQLNWRVGVDPVHAMQRCGGAPGDDSVSSRPQPRRHGVGEESPGHVVST